jgi:hypothetical protein
MKTGGKRLAKTEAWVMIAKEEIKIVMCILAISTIALQQK